MLGPRWSPAYRAAGISTLPRAHICRCKASICLAPTHARCTDSTQSVHSVGRVHRVRLAYLFPNLSPDSPFFRCYCESHAFEPRPVWLSGLNAGLRTERSLVRFPVRACTWVAGQAPSGVGMRGNQWVYLSHIDVSFPLFLSPFPSKNK